MGSALITWGGWDGHEPDKVAEIFRKILVGAGHDVTVTDSLECFDDPQHCRRGPEQETSGRAIFNRRVSKSS